MKSIMEWLWSGDGCKERVWSQRYKANQEKLESGDLVQVAEVDGQADMR